MSDARSGLPFPAVIIAVLAAATIGCVVGFAARYFSEPPPPKLEPQIIQQELSPEELAKLCEPEFKDERATLMEAQNKVKSLQGELDAKNTELAQLKAEAEKNSANREAAIARWKAKEKEIADLKVQLAGAQSERDQIMTELQTTIRELNKEITARKKAEAMAEHYKGEATENLWSSFGNNAKVEICDRGTRRRHDKCHEAVESALTPALKDKFRVCVESYQAVPVLKRLEKKEDLPMFAEQLPDDNKFTDNGWYILFCDPSLPEAGAVDGMGEEPSVDTTGTLQTETPSIQGDGEPGTTGAPATGGN